MIVGCFYIAVSLSLIMCQTIIRPAIPALDGIYDLLNPFIIYFCLFRPVRETAPAVFLLGFVMDNLSGGPFGLYMTTYIWLFICIQWMVKYLRVKNTLLLPPVIVASVLMENLIFLGTLTLLTPGRGYPEGAMRTIAEQLVWAVITGPLILLVMDSGRRSWGRWAAARFGKDVPDDE